MEQKFRLTRKGRMAQKCLKRGMRFNDFSDLYDSFLGRLKIRWFIMVKKPIKQV